MGRLLDLIWPAPVGVERALADTARALYPSDEARTLAELERLLRLAYERGGWPWEVLA